MKTIKDLRSMSEEQLQSELIACKKEKFNLRLQQSTGQLENTAQFAKVRRTVAQINMLLTELKKNS